MQSARDSSASSWKSYFNFSRSDQGYLPLYPLKQGPRSLRHLKVKTLLLFSLIPFSLLLFFIQPHISAAISPSSLCEPHVYSSGKWVLSPLPDTAQDVLSVSGFEGCASGREYEWHLRNDGGHIDEYRRNASRWVWQPPTYRCRGMKPFAKEDLLTELVERGGWLLIGDSVTEEHFFSLSCTLYPHVIATPKYTDGVSFDRAWPQNLYLNPKSTLLPSLKLPIGFDIAKTPLVTFRRVDMLFSRDDLISIHKTLPPFDPKNATLSSKIFGPQESWDLSPSEYLPLFMAPLPEAHYRTLIVNTAGHWTETTFAFNSGIPEIFAFFGNATREWVKVVAKALKSDKEGRQVLVRSYTPGHENCQNINMPYDEIHPYQYVWYNWNWLDRFNDAFEAVVKKFKHPQIHFLSIDRPAQLRPDAHTSSDCLHIAVGTGVIEGWTSYITHYISNF